MHHDRFSVCRKMFPVKPINRRKAMMYSFYVLIVCVLFYFVICLGAYYVDSEKLLPSGEYFFFFLVLGSIDTKHTSKVIGSVMEFTRVVFPPN